MIFSQPIHSIYIHIPFCLRKCHYCVFPVHFIGNTPNSPLIPLYLTSLHSEISHSLNIYSRTFPKNNLTSLYFGGGTPSLLDPCDIEKLMKLIRNYYIVNENTEVSMELNPGTFDEDKIKILMESGINRFSLGVQSFNEKILDMLNRGHSLKDVYKSIEIFKKLGCKNVSWDLLTGLPFENRDNETEWKKEVERWRPEHLSVYSLILEEDSVFARKFGYKEGISPLPSQDDSAETYLSVHETLNKMGYSHYEISSFCQSPKFSCVHSDVYWEGNKPFFGFGMGAASLWAQTRITRPKTIKKYMKFVEGLIIDRMEVEGVLIEKEEGVQEAKSRLIGGLRRENGVEMKGFEKGVKEALWECCKELDDLLEIKEGRIKVKGMRGFLLCDEILARIFVFLEKKGL